MTDGPLPPENLWLRTIGGFLLALAVSAILALAIFPAVHGHGPPSGKSTARTDANAFVAAIKAYNTEYGKYPRLAPPGTAPALVANADLHRILSDREPPQNPRRITFLQTREFKPRSLTDKRITSGRDPKTGAFLDPWGNPYRIAIDSDYDEQIANPYPDDLPIQAGAIVWSLGKDGQQGAPDNPRTSKGSDDILSWQ